MMNNESYVNMMAIMAASQKIQMQSETAPDVETLIKKIKGDTENKVEGFPSAIKKLDGYRDLAAQGLIADDDVVTEIVDFGRKSDDFLREVRGSGFGVDGGNFTLSKFVSRHEQYRDLSRMAADRPSRAQKRGQAATESLDKIIALVEIYDENFDSGLKALEKIKDEPKGALYLNGFYHLYDDFISAFEEFMLKMKSKLGVEESPEQANTRAVGDLNKTLDTLENAVNEAFKKVEDRKIVLSAEDLAKFESDLKSIEDGEWKENAAKMEQLGLLSTGEYEGQLAKTAARLNRYPDRSRQLHQSLSKKRRKLLRDNKDGDPDVGDETDVVGQPAAEDQYSAEAPTDVSEEVKDAVLDLKTDMLARISACREAVSEIGAQADKVVSAVKDVFTSILKSILGLVTTVIKEEGAAAAQAEPAIPPESAAESAAQEVPEEKPAEKATVAPNKHRDAIKLMDDFFGEKKALPKALSAAVAIAAKVPGGSDKLQETANKWRSNMETLMKASGLHSDGTFTPPSKTVPASEESTGLPKTAYTSIPDADIALGAGVDLPPYLSGIHSDILGYWKALEAAHASPELSSEEKAQLSSEFEKIVYGDDPGSFKSLFLDYYGTTLRPEEQQTAVTDAEEKKKEDEVPVDAVSDSGSYLTKSALFNKLFEMSKDFSPMDNTILNNPKGNKASYDKIIGKVLGKYAGPVAEIFSSVESAIKAVPAQYKSTDANPDLGGRSVLSFYMYGDKSIESNLLSGLQSIGMGKGMQELTWRSDEIIKNLKDPTFLEELKDDKVKAAQKKSIDTSSASTAAKRKIFYSIQGAFKALVSNDATSIHPSAEGFSEIVDPMSGLLTEMQKYDEERIDNLVFEDSESTSTLKALPKLVTLYTGGGLSKKEKVGLLIGAVSTELFKIISKEGSDYKLNVFPDIKAAPKHISTAGETGAEKAELKNAEEVRSRFLALKKAAYRFNSIIKSAFTKAGPAQLVFKVGGDLEVFANTLDTSLQGMHGKTVDVAPEYNALVEKGLFDADDLGSYNNLIKATALLNSLKVGEINSYTPESRDTLLRDFRTYFSVPGVGSELTIPAFPGYKFKAVRLSTPLSFSSPLSSGQTADLGYGSLGDSPDKSTKKAPASPEENLKEMGLDATVAGSALSEYKTKYGVADRKNMTGEERLGMLRSVLSPLFDGGSQFMSKVTSDPGVAGRVQAVKKALSDAKVALPRAVGSSAKNKSDWTMAITDKMSNALVGKVGLGGLINFIKGNKNLFEDPSKYLVSEAPAESAPASKKEKAPAAKKEEAPAAKKESAPGSAPESAPEVQALMARMNTAIDSAEDVDAGLAEKLDNLKAGLTKEIAASQKDVMGELIKSLLDKDYSSASDYADFLMGDGTQGMRNASQNPVPPASPVGRVISAYLSIVASEKRKYKVTLDPHMFKGSRKIDESTTIESNSLSLNDLKRNIRVGHPDDHTAVKSALRTLLAKNLGVDTSNSGLVFNGKAVATYAGINGALKSHGYSSDGDKFLDILKFEEVRPASNMEMLRRKEDWEAGAPKENKPSSKGTDPAQTSFLGG